LISAVKISRLTASSLRPIVTRGFTLLEILVSIAIIALISTVLITGTVRLVNEQPLTPHEVFWKAVQEARKAALKSEHEIRLKFDKEKKQFLLIDGVAPSTIAADGFTREERALKQFPISPRVSDGLTIDFLPPPSRGGGSAILVGGVLIDTQSVPYVRFFADGTCSAFRAQFVRGTGTSTLHIDPWTCAPMLTPNDPNAPLSR
jgi:prepilin-type N-terminal cleavage/methylation domain-containing protein